MIRCWLTSLTRMTLVGLLVVSLLGLGPACALAQSAKSVPLSQLGVDVVSLKSGKPVRGAILKSEANGSVTMAVSREWLKQANPELLVKLTAEEATEQRVAWEQLRDRLTKLLDMPPESQRSVFFMKQELERVEKLLAQAEPPEAPQFVWFEAKREAIAKVTPSAPDRQRIALWGWGERLKEVETRDVADLTRELKQKGVDPTKPAPDLSDQLAARPQDEREWAARLALVEYAFGTPIDFQGTGEVLVRSDASRDLKEMAPVIAKVLRGQVDSFLKDLTGDGRPAKGKAASNNDWLKSAQLDTERLGATGFRATRVDLNVEGRQTAVQSAFVVRINTGPQAQSNWETIWSHRETADATKPRAETEARIANDPQVKQALDTVKSLGLGAEDQVQQAIRFGAATMAAQQTADSRFFEFRDRHLKHLDGPPLWWTK
ncbi:MAG: hypothetical protein AABP62_14645 [Planctomycetota bacterium]